MQRAVPDAAAAATAFTALECAVPMSEPSQPAAGFAVRCGRCCGRLDTDAVDSLRTCPTLPADAADGDIVGCMLQT